MFSNNLLMAAAGGGDAGYVIEGSGLFAYSPYLSIATGSDMTATKWTFEWIIKKSNATNEGDMFHNYTNASNYTRIHSQRAGGDIRIIDRQGAATKMDISTTAVFRDNSAFYHYVFTYDSTPAVPDGDDIYLTINGVKQTALGSSTYPVQNQKLYWGTSGVTRYVGGGPTLTEIDGYVARATSIQGTAYAATSFGEETNDGYWQINDISDLTFGSEGFLLEGGTNVAAGTDSSGNTNNLTPSGTITATNDSPTNGGDSLEYGNYCTWNPLNYATNMTLSNGNRTVTKASSDWQRVGGTLDSSNPFYFEVHMDTGISFTGLMSNGNDEIGGSDPFGASGAGFGVQNNEKGGPTASLSGITLAISADDYVNVAFDPSRGAAWFGVNGVWKDGTASTASSATILAEIESTGTAYAIFTGIDSAKLWRPMTAMYTGNASTGRFSEADCDDAAPSGFSYLATQNAPDPAIPDPDDYIFVGTMSHNGTTGSVTVAFDCTLYDYMVEVKLDGTESWWVGDSIMGITKYFSWDDATTALQTDATFLTSVTSTTFTFGAALASGTYRVIIRKAGLQASRGTQAESGSGDGALMATTYSANQTSGFSIVSCDGFNDTIASGQNTYAPHGLGATPDFMQGFNQDTAAGRPALTGTSIGGTMFSAGDNYMLMDANSGKSGALETMMGTDATNLHLGNDDLTNKADDQFTYYCYVGIEGYSAWGSWFGNANADGPAIIHNAHFKTLMLKNTRAAGGYEWIHMNSEGNPYNVATTATNFDTSNGEGDSLVDFDFNSNGLKSRDGGTYANKSGEVIIYGLEGGTPIQGPGDGSTSQGRAR